MSYVELHARSAFSFHRGASHPETLARRAAELGCPALALTDRDGLYGSARAHHAAQEAGGGFRALVGAEITLDDELALPVLVRTRTGYQSLCQLLTHAKLRGLDPADVTRVAEAGLRYRTARVPDAEHLNRRKDSRVHWSELAEFIEPGTLIALTGDEEGPIRRALATGDDALAADRLRRLIALFGKEYVLVEIQRHRVRGEEWTNRRLLDLAAAHGLRAIASNSVVSATRQGRIVADAFACLRHHTHLDAAGTLLSRNGERHLKGPAEMAALFPDHPELLANTRRTADRIEFTLEDLGYRFPDYPVPVGHDAASFLREQAYRGARERWPRITPAIRRQLDHELRLIAKLGFSGYFLIVQDIVNFARSRGILVQGRGSAANSAVCYCLRITAVDAIRQKLLFERFLSEGRNSWPDIDLDLPSGERRETVIQGVFHRYAPRGAAMTANVITYRGRSAMREMGKVLDIPTDTLNRFSDAWGSSHHHDEADLRERVREAGLDTAHPRLPALIQLYQGVHSLPRHLGQHSGGMIISDRGLDTVVPLENATMEHRRVVQWDKDDCEDLGIIKVDLLGLGMLAAMQDTVELCRARGRPVDLATIPKDDPATYDLLCRADTIGVFQVESRAQMATLPRMRPREFYDLCVEVALIRPGPIAGDMVHPYLNRRNGLEPVDCIDERFRPALERTLGVPLFQEQVLQMAMIAADFDGSEAEELRRAISFHRSNERMTRVMAKLRAAMDRKQVSPAVQERIVASISSFALYGFPESHAISFALIAYASAWLKVHRPAEFYVGLLNNQPMGFYSRATLVKDARHRGLAVRPVDVTVSEVECTVEEISEPNSQAPESKIQHHPAPGIIRLGLNQVKGLGRTTAARLIAERRLASFASIEDFLLRVQPGRDERRVLAKVGALRSLPGSGHRREALWKTERPLDPDDLFSRALQHPTSDIPDPTSEIQNPRSNIPDRTSQIQHPKSPPLRPMDAIERLQADYDGLGLTTGRHPMAYLRGDLDRDPRVRRACDLATGQPDDEVIIAGLVICRQRPGTAKGHVFISLEDETGIANAFVHGDLFDHYRLVITQEPFLRITGRLQIQHGVTSVYTEHVEGIAFAATVRGQSHDFH
ncbi:MAG: error-prone DNA polymerase [Verrucomicrobiales bacterium]|nr:error-prone DNA polymerase [Verrucomicrobiales bacterium]